MSGVVMLVGLVIALSGGSVWWYQRCPVREHRAETIYQTVQVERRKYVRYLRFDSKSWQGAIDLRDPDRLLFPYQLGFVLFHCWRPHVDSFLAIGVGTGTALQTVRRLCPEALLYGVEIDAEVIRVAHQYFQCPYDERTRYYALDGRRFLQERAEDEQTFDLVFLDAYADDRMPPKLQTVEFVRLLKSRMSAGGLVCVNVIAALKGPDSRELRKMWRTYREVFTHVQVVTTSPLERESQNILLFASDTPPPSQEEMYEALQACVWPPSKRRLLRMMRRMRTPEWSLETEKPMTDDEVKLFQFRRQ